MLEKNKHTEMSGLWEPEPETTSGFLEFISEGNKDSDGPSEDLLGLGIRSEGKCMKIDQRSGFSMCTKG